MGLETAVGEVFPGGEGDGIDLLGGWMGGLAYMARRQGKGDGKGTFWRRWDCSVGERKLGM